MGVAVRERLAPAAILAVAGVNHFVGLGSSSLHIDEGLSWGAARLPLGDVIEGVKATETSPPLHYLGLHEVIGRISESEIAMRLPSALAGLALVAAVIWLGWLAVGRWAGLAAGALAAVSPLVLEFAQQARAYVFAMLACTIAACCVLEVERAAPQTRSRRICVAGAAAAAATAMLLHYTSAFVVAPMALLAWRQRRVRPSEGLVLGAAIAAPFLLTLPLVFDQTGKGLEQGVEFLGRLTLENVVELAGTPFVDRAADYGLTPAGADPRRRAGVRVPGRAHAPVSGPQRHRGGLIIRNGPAGGG